MTYTCGIILIPRMTQLDFTAPYEVLARVPGMEIVLLAKTPEPVITEHGLAFTPHATFDAAPPLDMVLVPGGPGINETLLDAAYLDFLKTIDPQWYVSVCTGALLLGAAGLLRGYRATTHWAALEFLPALGAIAVADQRVVIDRNRITGGGVTAGIDLALHLTAILGGEELAQAIQLSMEYAPAPPFNAGSPRTVPPAVLEEVRRQLAPLVARRRELMAKVAAGLAAGL